MAIATCIISAMATETSQQKQTKLTIELVRQMLTLATAGFGLVAALAWNNLIQEFVNDYIKKWLPGNGGIITLLAYAIIITIIAVVVTFQLSKILRHLEEKSA